MFCYVSSEFFKSFPYDLVLEDTDAQVIANFLIDGFPSTREVFPNSLHSRVLHRFAKFIFLLPDDWEEVEKPKYSSGYFYKVQAGIRAIDMLNMCSFNMHEDAAEEDEEDVFRWTNASRKLNQKQRRNRQSRKSVSLDASVFKIFDETVPSCYEEADILSKKLLSELWLILQVINLVTFLCAFLIVTSRRRTLRI